MASSMRTVHPHTRQLASSDPQKDSCLRQIGHIAFVAIFVLGCVILAKKTCTTQQSWAIFGLGTAGITTTLISMIKKRNDKDKTSLIFSLGIIALLTAVITMSILCNKGIVSSKALGWTSTGGFLALGGGSLLSRYCADA